MNKHFLVFGLIIIIWIGLGVIYTSSSPQEGNDAMLKSDDTSMIKDETMMAKDEEIVMVKEEGEVMMTKPGSYEVYSPEKIARATDSDVVLFFRATWCPTCKALDSDIKSNLSEIPSGLVVLDVDYDNSSELKKKYGVNYQHTLVQVDKDGNLIKKWSGSPTLAMLIKEVK